MTMTINKEEINITNKPSLGIMPRFLWDEYNPSPTIKDLMTRKIDLLGTIIRRNEDPYNDVPKSWIDEMKSFNI